MYDLLIRGGRIADGTGRPPFVGDVAVTGQRIAEVGRVRGHASRIIDASGLLVTPGFIDPHTHLDGQLFWDPLVTPCCWHGVTTVVAGNCGVGFAPVRSGEEERLARVLESVEEIPAESLRAGLPWTWEGFDGYLEALGARPLGCNAAFLVGHAPLRFCALGASSVEEGRQPDEAELALLRRLVADALAAGAFGLSTSRTRSHLTPEGAPIPGTFACDDEVLALADAVGRGGGLLQWVAGFGERDRSDDYPEVRREIRLMGEASRRSRRPVVLSVFTHRQVPTIHTHVLAWVEEERAAGADLRPMFNPRPGTTLLGLESRSPLRGAAWRDLFARPFEERLLALEDPDWRERLARLPAEREAAEARDLFLFGPERCEYERRPERRLDRVARERGERPAETVVRLMRETRGRQIFAGAGSNHLPGHIEEVFQHPGCLVGLGDAGAHVAAICDASLTTHVLAHWCRDRGRITIAEAVRRLTSEPASTFGIRGRGIVAPGFFADLNVIDLALLAPEVPELARDLPAGAGRWTQRARGYVATIVNGEVAIESDRHTGRLAGRLLRRGREERRRRSPRP